MQANPIIRRYRFSQFRLQQVGVFGAVYAGLVLLILFINSSIYLYGHAYPTQAHLYKGLFVQFAVLEVFLLWLLCPGNCSTVVSREIVDKSFDFFRMLPLRASQKAAGILIGRNLFYLSIGVINLGLCLGFGFAAGLSKALILQLLAALLALAVMLNVLALMFSVLSFKKTKTNSFVVLLVIGFFAFGPLMGIIYEVVYESTLEETNAYFYTFAIPVVYLVAVYALFFAVWAYVGVLRRFKCEYEALFSRLGAGLFMLTFMAMLGGLFYVYLLENGSDAIRGFWVLGLLPVAVVPLFAIRDFGQYLEISRAAHRLRGLGGRLMMNSNIVGGVVLFAIWLVFGGAACFAAEADREKFMWLAILTFSFLLVLLALLETYALWRPINEKIGYLLGFFAVLYGILPLILGSIFENEVIYLFSPFGILSVFDEFYDTTTLLMPIVFNLICLVLPGLLIAKRYRDLIEIRSDMDKNLKSELLMNL